MLFNVNASVTENQNAEIGAAMSLKVLPGPSLSLQLDNNLATLQPNGAIDNPVVAMVNAGDVRKNKSIRRKVPRSRQKVRYVLLPIRQNPKKMAKKPVKPENAPIEGKKDVSIIDLTDSPVKVKEEKIEKTLDSTLVNINHFLFVQVVNTK